MDKNLFSSFYLYKEHKQLICSNARVAFIQYKDFRINLLTGDKSFEGVDEFVNLLARFSVDAYENEPVVIHLMYDFGFHSVDELELVDSNKPLAIFIQYQEAKKLRGKTTVTDENDQFSLTPLDLPNFNDYHKKFEKTYRNLLDGECYQLNLTLPFYLRSSVKLGPQEYIDRLWGQPEKVGAYAHATYINSLGKLFLSNSPECLFQITKENKSQSLKLKTMPIKGTVSVANEKERKKAWKELGNSIKDQAELNIITDLMRNDLTKINLSPARVVHRRYPLHVPGLVHQFSVVETDLAKNNTLKDIILSIFPGGSITGAPKKNVMKLIKEIEKYSRGFYCGSTIFLYQHLKTASINIRSAEIDFLQDEIMYGSGGGITLGSEARAEYDEVLAKLKSFLLLLS